jgi:DNA-binding CsgD family transcriptional regulator
MSKSQTALIAALARMSIASPAFAQSQDIYGSPRCHTITKQRREYRDPGTRMIPQVIGTEKVPPARQVVSMSGDDGFAMLMGDFISSLPDGEAVVNGYTGETGDLAKTRYNCAGETLTVREREVLAMISQGSSNKHIARALEISPETVKSHVKHIFFKLAVSTRTEAVFRAVSLDLL